MFRICFIDDDEEFEIPLFHDAFGEVFDILAANSYAELKSRIESRKGWKPDLFVLDLYFPSGSAKQEAIGKLKANPLSIESDKAEIRKAYSNYLKLKNRLNKVLDAWQQNAEGGLKLAHRITVDYPEVPIVFYSRKATLEDVIRCMTVKNVWSVEKKPTGKDSAETIELTKLAQKRLVQRFETAILKKGSEELNRKKQAAEVIVAMLQESG